MTSITRAVKPSHHSLHRYTTEEIKAEIRRREAAADVQKVFAALSATWEAVGVIAARAGLPVGKCGDCLLELTRSGAAQWTGRKNKMVFRAKK